MNTGANTQAAAQPPRKPWNPYLVLASAVVLPGTGQVLNGVPQRGLMFLFFIIVLAWVSVNLMPPGSSFVGRFIGGIFIYGLSVIDAYKGARVRWEKWKFAQA
ncbi:MAG TPA: hypothetical protein VGO53_00600 [Steroidobacteraceae bacterium]|nr:hypothetical protein [Steroidobacteraceae bacterium]